MLGAAICGSVSPITYLGVKGSHAMSPPSSGEFIRIELPPPLDTRFKASDAIATPAPAPAPDSEAMLPEPPPVEQDAGQPPERQGPTSLAQWNAADFALQDGPSPIISPAPKAFRGTMSLSGLSYDLAGGATSRNAIQTEKSVMVAGASSAKVRVRIDENAKIYVDARQLASLLPPGSLPQSQNGFVSFDQLRSNGVGVRYDASRDAIEMTPGGA